MRRHTNGLALFQPHLFMQRPKVLLSLSPSSPSLSSLLPLIPLLPPSRSPLPPPSPSSERAVFISPPPMKGPTNGAALFQQLLFMQRFKGIPSLYSPLPRLSLFSSPSPSPSLPLPRERCSDPRAPHSVIFTSSVHSVAWYCPLPLPLLPCFLLSLLLLPFTASGVHFRQYQ